MLHISHFVFRPCLPSRQRRTTKIHEISIQTKINLSATTRETTISREQQHQQTAAAAATAADSGSCSVVSPSVDLFAEALDEVSKLLQRDAFAQFRTTDAFLRFKREWHQEVGHEIIDVVSRND